MSGEHTDQTELFVAVDQRLIDLTVDGVGEQLVLRVRVHGLQIALAGPAESLGGTDGRRCDQQRRQQDSNQE